MKLLILLLTIVSLNNAQDYSFPDDFLFGVATASYQVEGGWNESDKGENIWDHITHVNPSFVIDESNGDYACDSYHRIAEDVQIIKDIGVNFYRFSLSWSRILPTGHINYVSEDGVQYYNNLIDELIANDITPFVTIFHWDLPQPLLELGGWPNSRLADLYEDYAATVFELFGDRVKNWITFNEPYQICEQGYSIGDLAPGYTQQGIGGYLCGHTVLLAHAQAYHRYHNEFSEQGGRVGIVAHGAWGEPETDSDDDAAAAEAFVQMFFGWFLHPIYSEDGDYPAIMREQIDALSAEQDFLRSRLPTFTEAQIESLRGASDFLGLNHYGAYLCRASNENDSTVIPSHGHDMGAYCYLSDEWEASASDWFSVTPWSLRSILNWIKDNYGNPEVVVTENGFTTTTGEVADCRRVNYYNTYLQSLLEAIYEDECNVTGYTAWSIMDNFEWQFGYTAKFGLYSVDFDDENRTRTPKMSSYIYRNIIETRQIDTTYTPDGFDSCIEGAATGLTISALLISISVSLHLIAYYF